MTTPRHKIGIVDSGVGGLTILDAVRTVLPEYDYVYIADTARIPYGTQDIPTLIHYAEDLCRALFAQDASLVIFACNTLSGPVLQHIQTHFLPEYFPDKKVLGMVIPTSEHVAATYPESTIGLFATTTSVASGIFVKKLQEAAPRTTVHALATPALVPLIEDAHIDTPEMRTILTNYLADLPTIDVLLLGCTHYGFIADTLRTLTSATVVTQGTLVADALAQYLERHTSIATLLAHGGSVTYYTTGSTERFAETTERLLGTARSATHLTLT